MERTTLFADILLPLPIKGYFTYRVPHNMNDLVGVGARVVVPFGPKKLYSGLVRKIHKNPPKKFTAKYINSCLDEKPIINELQFLFWEWMSEYYLCSVGEVMNTALPPAMKLASETKVVFNPDFDNNFETLNEKEYLVAEALELRDVLTISEISKITGLAKVFNLIKNLIEKDVVLLKEELQNPYRPRVETFISLNEKYDNEEELKELFDKVEKRAPKQLELLMEYIKQSGRYEPQKKEVMQSSLLKAKKNPYSALNALIDKGVFGQYKKKVSRFTHEKPENNNISFSPEQTKALEEIDNAFSEKDVVLLHGITSSGKTEIYIKLIKEYIEKGCQVLYLLPEIALTTQITQRLRKHFGSEAGIYHSKFNDNERVEVWSNIAYGGIESLGSKISYKVVIGPRSALFLPYSKLGLIIVDEEHEGTYKQQDFSPRFNARDAAVFLGKLSGAKVLMGSATPAIETFFNAKTEKFGLVNINKRHGGVMPPEILVADVKRETRLRTMKSHFSSLLMEKMKEALSIGKQVLLFQNRRGFSLRIECKECNWMPQCNNCDVTLVYHKHINSLKCHYCGYTSPPPGDCPDCGSNAVFMKGFGTEKIEEELPVFFPDANIARMDTDTTRAKHAYQRIIDDFSSQKIDILIGTQMLSKGLDFKHVGVVGILNADNMLSVPDFRAHERAYQLMTQVSGRAGRNKERGVVVIQSMDPWHAIIRMVIDSDYYAMYESQIEDRRRFKYPPFFRLVRVSLQHRDPQLLSNAAAKLAESLRQLFGDMALGPEFPPIARVRNLYKKNILVKLQRDAKLKQNKQLIFNSAEKFKKEVQWKGVRVIIDVDPY